MILVTGASGYVGNNLVRRLVQLGKPVRAMVGNVQKALKRLADVEPHIEIVKGDVTRPETLTEWMKGVDVVIHLVAIAIEKGKRTYELLNTQGTINVVEEAKKAGVRRFINMCQNGAYPDVKSRFLRSKGIAQEYVAKSGLDWTAIRPSVIWGPQDEFANVQARLIKLTPIVFPIVGDGKAQFQPVYVGDVVEAIVRCLEDDSTIGKEYELGGPEVLTYEEIVDRVLAALGTRRIKVKVPVPLLRPVVWLMQNVLPNPPATTTLLELLAVPNVIKEDGLAALGITPKPFTPENLSYMKHFTIGTTIGKFLGRAFEEERVRQTAMGK
ncbi:MAG: complex I NDUFA9 subunit family protein [Anaerolineae bacterium]|nr:complex I NDUFA9 subunit family protein [Anaerolineae bacterium]MDW8300486.1 complex I NDUFA9 subunit family protein [Anaerolineae bacterium]